MLRKSASCVGVLGAIVFAICCPTVVRASFHEWKIVELFSNASGSIQYVKLQQPSIIIDDERFVGSLTITDTVSGNVFTIPQNLPGAPVANQFFLVGTPGYAALSGVPAPDYTFAANNFTEDNGIEFPDFSGGSTGTFRFMIARTTPEMLA